MNEYETLSEWCRQEKTEVPGEKLVAVQLSPPHLPHWLAWDGTRSSALRDERLGSWVIARRKKVWYIRATYTVSRQVDRGCERWQQGVWRCDTVRSVLYSVILTATVYGAVILSGVYCTVWYLQLLWASRVSIGNRIKWASIIWNLVRTVSVEMGGAGMFTPVTAKR